MKRYPRPYMFSAICLLGAAALLGGCGGGNDDAPGSPSEMATMAGVQTAAPLNAASSVTQPDAAADEPNSAHDPVSVASADSAALALPQPSSNANPGPAATRRQKLPLTLNALLQFNADFRLGHEALPSGVPSSYDWFARPRKGTWNTVPEGFSALTGWGQAFWTQGTGAADAYLLLRNHMTLLCHGASRRWTLLQASRTEGAEFRPDYAGNVAKSAFNPGPIEAGADAVGFAATSAYHFWPKAGRGKLPYAELCGMLVLVQARAEPVVPDGYAVPSLLLGLGADYWQNQTAAWDNYRTNRDVAIGRLRLVTVTWNWFGLSTASDADLRRLFNEGYEDAR